MPRRLAARIAGLLGLVLVAALLSPLSGAAEEPPAELVYACALKSNGTLRVVDGPGDCGKKETLVTFKPGPVLLCVQPSGSARKVSSFRDCRPPATQLTVPPTSGAAYFCATAGSGVLRWVADPAACLPTETALQVTPNDDAPTVTSTVPSDGALAGRDTTVSITFSEDVSAIESAFALECGGDPISFAMSGLPGGTAVLTPSGSLPTGHTCSVTTTASLVSDLDANDPPDTMVADHTFSFTVDSPPSVSTTVPADGTSDVAVDTDLTVTFSESVDAAPGAFTLACDIGGAIPVAVTGSPGSSITIDPVDDLQPADACELVVHADQVSDEDTADPPDHPTADHTVSFVTADVAPAVTGTVPLNQSADVPTDTQVRVTWSESVAVVADAIVVDCGAGAVAGTLSGSPGTTTTFTPSAALPDGATCSILVDRTKVTDVDAVDPPDRPAADHTFSFETDAAPAFLSSSPTDGASDVDPAANVVLTFSEPVTATASAFALSCNAVARTVTVGGSGTDTLTLTPTGVPQTAACSLTILGAHVHDADAFDPPDTLASDVTISYATVDAAPQVTATSPTNGAGDVPAGTDITVTFSEAVDVTESGVSLACPSGSPVSFTLTEGAGNVWTLDPAGPLPADTECTVAVTAGAVTDDDLVDPPDEMAADHTFTFTVSANSAPTDITLSPASVQENQPSGTTVGTLGTIDSDPGDTFTYSLVSGTGDTDNARFAIIGDTLTTAGGLDFETTSTLSVRVRTTDSAGAHVDKAFTVTVINVNESPTDLALSVSSVEENRPGGTTVGLLSGTDPDAGDLLSFSLVSGAGDTDNASFSLTGTALKTAASFNFEVKSSYSVRIRVTDAGSLTHEEAVVISVVDVNDPPVAVTDAYTGAIGNTLAVVQTTGTGPHTVLTGNVITSNDSDEDVTFPHTLTAVAGTVSSTGGGTATIAADGSFTFLPGVGDTSQTDSFTYQVTDGELTGSGTVTVGIGTDIVWYVNNDSVAPSPDGRSTSPLLTLAGLGGVDPDGPGHTIFVYSGSGSYGGGLVLEASQRLLGQPHGLTVDGTPLVAASGTAPVITNAGGAGLTLANGVDVQGISVSGSSGPGISGTGVTTATIGTETGVQVTANATGGVNLTGGSGAISVAATISGNSGPAVTVSGRTGGSTTFSGPVTGGVTLSANSGATIQLTGGVSASTGTAPAFSATGGGTVVVTGSANTLATTTGTALVVEGTTIGASGLTFRSVSADGAVNGIRLSGTGTQGSLTVTGTGSTALGGDGSGGTIQNTSGAGVLLTDTTGTSLNNLTLVNTAGPGVDGTGVSGFAFTNGTINGSGTTSRTAFDSNVAFNDSGPTVTNVSGAVTVSNSRLLGAYQHGIDILNNDGTITDLQLTNNQISSPTAQADSQGSAIRVNELGSAGTVSSLTRGSISGNDITGFPTGGGIVLQGGNTASASAPAGTFGTSGAGNAVVVSGNLIRGHSAANPMNTNCILVTMPARGTGYLDIVNNGTAATPLGLNRGNCISVNVYGDYHLVGTVTNNHVKPQAQIGGAFGIAFGTAAQTVGGPAVLDSAVLDLDVQNNTVSGTTGSGIRSTTFNTGTTRARIKNNTVAAPTELSGAYGIRVDSGSSSSVDTYVCLDLSGNTTAGSLNSGTGNTAPGIGLRKQGTVEGTHDFRLVGLSPSPADAAQTVAYVSTQNPFSAAGTSGAQAEIVSGSNFASCVLPF
ncbi:Ig-like domain-containing protein [Intrasporangium calvum]|uniref:Ig-like domain-containing protein n=1 Tax=Intrasporangium calvum TaxID=53358 RepID=A0ABT5GJQ1_9MICO|nr:Ig-like domain-containing protein [Intrasporangium calvum]MDC5698472.1 Ig-like domain-containing protein [Intrasporangium calvum]